MHPLPITIIGCSCYLQQKFKEERANRVQDLQLTHRHVCDMVAIYLGLEPSEVIDGVVDDAEYVTLLDNVINMNQRKAIMFFYQEMPPYPLRK